MNNTKTRFVIAISQKLSAAPDSDAKVDLIEELSENLYGRYQDMVASGMQPEEAYAAALDKLGDVNELLAYLGCCDKQAPRPDGPWSGAAEDLFGSLDGFIKQTVDQAVNAANDAAAMVRDAARSFDGGRRVSPAGDGEAVAVSSQELTELKVSITGDLTVYLDGDLDAPVRLAGDTEDLQVEQDGGTLKVTQDKSAGGSFFFSRGLSSPRVKLTIPQRHWDRLEFSTGSGDVKIHDGALEADHVCVKTTSGDMELNRLNASQSLVVQTASGDLSLTNSVCGQLLFHSASGDLEGENVTAPMVVVQTASGDVSLSGDIFDDVKALTASGDLDLDCGALPDVLQLATKSGDCSVRIPDSGGFIVRFSTVSGEIDSDFPLTTAAGESLHRRAGEAFYKDGGGRVFTLSTVSGDIELQRN